MASGRCSMYTITRYGIWFIHSYVAISQLLSENVFGHDELHVKSEQRIRFGAADTERQETFVRSTV